MSIHELSPLNNPEVVGEEESLNSLVNPVLDEFVTVVSANSQRHKKWPQYMLALSMVLIACTTDKTESPTPWSTPTSTPTEIPTSIPTETLTPTPTETPTSVPTETATIAPTETPIPIPTLLPPNGAGGELPIWLDEETGVEPTVVAPTAMPVSPTATPGAEDSTPVPPEVDPDPTATPTPVPPGTPVPDPTEVPVTPESLYSPLPDTGIMGVFFESNPGPELLRPMTGANWSIIGTDRCPGNDKGKAMVYVETIIGVDRINRIITVNTSVGSQTIFIPRGTPVYLFRDLRGNHRMQVAEDFAWGVTGGIVPGIHVMALPQSSCNGAIMANPGGLSSDPIVALGFGEK